MRRCLFPFVLMSVLSSAPFALGGSTKTPTYWQDIRPILRKNCLYCHAQRHVKKVDVSGGLALDDYKSAMKGSKKPVVRPGDAAKSRLAQLLVSPDPKQRMPLDGEPLPAEQIKLIQRWIDAGAKEGKRPDDVPVPNVAARAKRRKRDVEFDTNVAPPRGVLGKAAPAPLHLRLRIGPLAPVTAVAFSPDGKRLASGRYGQVTIWDVQKVRPLRVLTNVLGSVNDLEFSPDGKFLVVAGGQPSARGDLRLYDTDSWNLLAASREHGDVIFSVDFAPDGKTLATASFDATARIWRVKDLKLQKTLTGHSDFVYATAFSPDGKLLATASKDRTVRLTEAKSGKGVFTLGGMEQDVMAVAFAGDGKHVVSSGFETALYWWDVKTGEKVKTQRGHGRAVHELDVSKNGGLIVSAGADRTVRLWDGRSGSLIKTISAGSPIYAVAIHPQGKWIASGGFAGYVQLWRTKGGQPVATLLTLPPDEDGGFDWLALTPQGFVSASEGIAKTGRWFMRGASVPAGPVWRALGRSDRVVRAIHGGDAAKPSFEKR